MKKIYNSLIIKMPLMFKIKVIPKNMMIILMLMFLLLCAVNFNNINADTNKTFNHSLSNICELYSKNKFNECISAIDKYKKENYVEDWLDFRLTYLAIVCFENLNDDNSAIKHIKYLENKNQNIEDFLKLSLLFRKMRALFNLKRFDELRQTIAFVKDQYPKSIDLIEINYLENARVI